MENQNQSFNNHFEDYNLALDCLLLLFKVQNVQEKRSSGVEVRTKLKGFLLKVKQNEEVKNLADICFQFAQECEHSKDIDSAIMFLNDALNWNPVHVPAMVALARIRLSRGEVIECEQKCAFILKANPLNNVANDIINSLMLNKDLYESAFQHLNQVLQKEANCYSSLSQLVTLLEKFGRHEEIVHYLEAAERSLSNSYMPAGLFYCKGLHAWYSKDLHQALRMFNNARADKEWGQKAIHNMVEIYLSINNDMINDETHVENDTKVGEEEMHTALELLVESRMIDETSVRQVALECYALMVLKRKEDVEVALSRLQNITGSEKDHIVIRLAIATALVILKQSSKAKGELRVIERMTYRWEYGEDFERAWLMLANIHIQGGKTSAAEQLCKSCLKYNKSCSKAWEYLGLLMEKAQSYSEAISFYEKAWKYHRGTSLSIGYKLALCYLKAKQHIEAITVCQKVLKVFPEYGKIRKDILDKARQCLRP